MAETQYEIPVNDEFVKQILDKPEKFIVPDNDLEKEILGITKNLFDYGIKKEDNSSCPLEELYIEGFDNDQIWEEIQLQNVPLIKQFNEISDDIIENDLKMSEDEDEINEDEINKDDYELEGNEDDEEMENVDDIYEQEEKEQEENKEEEEDDDDDDYKDILDTEGFNKDDMDNEIKASNSNRKFKKTVVDDQFFSLREMEAFAEEFERKDILRSRRFNKEEDGEEDSENDEGMADEDYEYMNFDQDFDDEDDDMEIRYEDFFAPPEEYEKNKGKTKSHDQDDKIDKNDDDMEEEEESEEENEEGKTDLDDDGFPNLHENDEDENDSLINKENEEENEEEDEEEDDDEGQNLTTKISNLFSEDNEDEGEGEALSTFEKSQKKMQETIDKLEEEAVADKYWALKGEVSSKGRPLNSLLEEDIEVEHASKPVPVITEEVTQTLEDMIRQRILDNLFDDVERKIDINTLKPKYDPNKQFELFEEQKKQSLSEVYENEYLRQTAGEHQSEKEIELEKRHQEIDELFKKLCQNLDALSNWHYAPKPAKMEMTVVSNVPSIQMEEVLPIHESENTLLAPEEAYEKPKTDVKGETEIDSNEKKRQRARRRKIKKLERKQKEKEQKIRAKILPNSISQKYGNKKQALETLTGNKNVTIISNSSLNLPGGKKKKGNSAKVISTSGGKAISNDNRQISLKL